MDYLNPIYKKILMLKQKIYIFDNFSKRTQIICYDTEITHNAFPIRIGTERGAHAVSLHILSTSM